MSTATVTATIEELDAMLADDTLDRCKGRTILTVGPWHLDLSWCNKAAVAMVTVVCSEHGVHSRPICAKHRRALLRGAPPCCPVCHETAGLSGVA